MLTEGTETFSDDSKEEPIISAKVVPVTQPTAGPSRQAWRSSTENPGELPAKVFNE